MVLGSELPQPVEGCAAAAESRSTSLYRLSAAITPGASSAYLGLRSRAAVVKRNCLRQTEIADLGAGAKRACLETDTDHDDNAGGTTRCLLEDELQEKIIAKLPLPFLYQALALSKIWSEKLKNPGPFRDEVRIGAERWPLYCPVHVSTKGLIGYDSVSMQWHKVFSFTHIPSAAYRPALELCSGAGSLICFAINKICQKEGRMRELGEQDGGIRDVKQMALFKRKDYWVRNSRFSMALLEQEFDICVTNVVTKQWRLLPSRPKMQRPHIMHLTIAESGGYRLILLTRVEHEVDVGSNLASVCAQIYDSSSNSWIVDFSETSQFQMRNSHFAYFEKTMYIMCLDTCKAYNLDNRSWRDIPLPCFTGQSESAASVAMAQTHAGVVVCNSSVMLIMGWNANYAPGHFVKKQTKGTAVIVVYKLDQGLQEFVQVSRGPPETIIGISEAYIDVIAGHGENIYFGSKYVPSSPVLRYTFSSEQWKAFPPAFKTASFHTSLDNLHWANFAFQPGINPFAEV